MTADTYPNLYAALQHIDAIASTGWLHQDSLSHAGLVELLQEIIDAAREAMPAAHQAVAAPDLLAALQAVVAWLSDSDVSRSPLDPERARLAKAWMAGALGPRVRDAIAKAGG